ncbi:MAG TPA: hypothetical protein VMU54_14180, partial [Planctomycetota bacterium]|nr:hypothetical protein [Planctomycetota bacterium]
MKVLMTMLVLLVPSPAPDGGLEPWASRTLPGDVPKHRVEEVSDAKHAYAITQSGTMDGANCCSPVGVGMGSW